MSRKRFACGSGDGDVLTLALDLVAAGPACTFQLGGAACVELRGVFG
jgi:hypothetical protein